MLYKVVLLTAKQVDLLHTFSLFLLLQLCITCISKCVCYVQIQSHTYMQYSLRMYMSLRCAHRDAHTITCVYVCRCVDVHTHAYYIH